ncbi:waprin-Thr1 [Planococcus citri]|uniref:waprin-Thr1 n=1 Tax=Planococcus citri TaxID=170843 RepID=UPI0031F73326
MQMQMQIGEFISFFTVVTLCLIICAHSAATKGVGSCPIKQSVKNCLPKCISDYECYGNKRCCPNICNSKSCADVNPGHWGNDDRQSDEVIICGNVRCQPRQTCKSEGPMKRPKCSW